MNRLVTVIGPAPSELSFPDLITKLQLERTRVRNALERFRAQPIKKPRGRKKKAPTDMMNIQKMLKDGLITQAEILDIIKKGK